MKEQMSSKKAWLILGGLLVVFPVLVMGYIKYWNCAYNLFF